MLGSIYIGLSGMTAYSRGLDTISNNVANMNTPGFKVSQPRFVDLLFQNSTGAVPGSGGAPSGGAGVENDASRQSFRQGELRDTGNPLDVAIDGEGYFVMERNGDWLFTRTGQFEIDKDGVLVERNTRAKALVSTSDAGVTTFDLDEYRVFAPKATTEVSLAGALARPVSGATTPNGGYELSNLTVVDAGGARHTLKAKFVRDADDQLKWTVEVMDSDEEVVGHGEINFNPDGTPSAENEPITVELTPENQSAFSFVLKMGEPGTFSGVASTGGTTTSQLSVVKQDGIQLGTLVSTSFDDRGRITLKYSNGETLTPATMMLAQFSSPDQFRSLGGGIYGVYDGQRPLIGEAQTGGRGRVIGSRLEMSNVDLTQQFSDLIIIQRGFQAASQMTSVANEMLQQLLAVGNAR